MQYLNIWINIKYIHKYNIYNNVCVYTVTMRNILLLRILYNHQLYNFYYYKLRLRTKKNNLVNVRKCINIFNK